MRRNARNHRISRSKCFATRMIAEIRERGVRVVRIHEAGDFYSKTYIKAWRAIMKACPETRFFAYTRSWRVEELAGSLRRLASLPNFELWYSEDADTGPAPRHKHVRRAFLVIKPEDEQAIPAGSNLVFRDKIDRPAKKMAGVLVCPYENGVIGIAGKTTCERCGICWSRNTTDKNSIRFSEEVSIDG